MNPTPFKRLVLVLALMLPIAPAQTVVAAPQVEATIAVNTGADGNTRDSVLTLREALMIARGELVNCLSNAEAAQLSDAGVFDDSAANCPTAGQRKSIGDPLAFSADTIIFAIGLSVITPTSQLPALYCLDKIRSDFSTVRRIAIQGGSAGAGAHGLRLDCNTAGSNNEVSYLTMCATSTAMASMPAACRPAPLSGLRFTTMAAMALSLAHPTGATRAAIGSALAPQTPIV